MVLLNYLDYLDHGDNCHGRLIPDATGAFQDKDPAEYYGSARYYSLKTPQSVKPATIDNPRPWDQIRQPAKYSKGLLPVTGTPAYHHYRAQGYSKYQSRRLGRLDRRIAKRKDYPIFKGNVLKARRKRILKRRR